MLCGKAGQGNAIHYGSQRCGRVTRSVSAAEVFGLVYGYNNAYVARSMLSEILGTEIPHNT